MPTSNSNASGSRNMPLTGSYMVHLCTMTSPPPPQDEQQQQQRQHPFGPRPMFEQHSTPSASGCHHPSDVSQKFSSQLTSNAGQVQPPPDSPRTGSQPSKPENNAQHTSLQPFIPANSAQQTTSQPFNSSGSAQKTSLRLVTPSGCTQQGNLQPTEPAPMHPPVPVSGLPDWMEAGCERAQLEGYLVFGGVREYDTEEAFSADAPLHCVLPGSPFGWKSGVTQRLYGWEIVSLFLHEPRSLSTPLVRFLRSIFKVT